MGEMADYALDETMDAEDDRFLYRIGMMGDGDAYDLGIIDELGFYDHKPMFSTARGPVSKTCKHCGKTGLRWKKTEHSWRLAAATGELHVCEQHKF